MNAARILETLQQHGVTCRRDGDILELKPATGSVPADMIALARAHKPELLQALPDTAEIARQRTRLLTVARELNIPRLVIAELPDADIAGCELLTDPGLRRYAQIVQENHLRARGVAILRPTQPTTRLPPRPAVTCATCTHMRRLPQTSPAGMQSCKANHGMHFANEQHACPDWHPLKVQP